MFAASSGAPQQQGRRIVQDDPSSTAPLRLKRRADFVRAAKGKRFHAKGFTLQAVERSESERAPAPPRFGFTVTKKVGGAVVRNRIRRRFKEALRTAEALPARPCRDYVIVARIEALRLAFATMQVELSRAIDKIESSQSKPDGRSRKRGPNREALQKSRPQGGGGP
ncbi:ribonuclease P protein component [Methylocella silvestris]|uniref:Ribonuclease P protein component n=2 Tax=Methylocella silvestris TaxID=199596 RepID=A0A2J7TGK1_METSI|nr:ribonuclease P protein component [Methylocella silvestris]